MKSGEFRTIGIEAALYSEGKQVKQVLPVAMRKAPRLDVLSGFIQINQDGIFFVGVLFNTLLGPLFLNWTWNERVHENREVGDGGSRMLAVEPAPSTVESFAFGLALMYGAKVEDDLDGRLGVFFPTPIEKPLIILDIGRLGKAVERIKSGDEGRCIGCCHIFGQLAVGGVVKGSDESGAFWWVSRFLLIFRSGSWNCFGRWEDAIEIVWIVQLGQRRNGHVSGGHAGR